MLPAQLSTMAMAAWQQLQPWHHCCTTCLPDVQSQQLKEPCEQHAHKVHQLSATASMLLSVPAPEDSTGCDITHQQQPDQGLEVSSLMYLLASLTALLCCMMSSSWCA